MMKFAPRCAKPISDRGRVSARIFLIHERVIDSILRLLDLDANAEVVEIGPGLGFLTRRLLDRA